VFLDVPISVLEARVEPNAERPLIRATGDLQRLLEERRPCIGSSPPTSWTARRSGEVADAIVEELRWSA
jgi:shikimate kinase